MTIDKNFIDKFVNITSKAALASSHLVGKKDKIAADKAAVDSMRSELNNLEMKGQIVIGEGELDEAPMLYIGEKLGTNNGPEFDIAVDPLEGTNFAANNLPGALSVIAVAKKNPDRIILKDLGIANISFARMKEVIIHELNHIYMFRIPQYRSIPAWFKEGMAMKSANEFSLLHKIEISHYAWKKKLVPLASRHLLQKSLP